jgi:phosphoenolpyruvate synthase/pyruvate phosphate dikinase
MPHGSGAPIAMYANHCYQRQMKASSKIHGMMQRGIEEAEAAVQNRCQFITRINLLAGLSDGRKPEWMRLIPDAATQMAQGTNQNRAGEDKLIEAVKHMHFRGSVTGSDERVIGFERSHVANYVERIRKEYVDPKTGVHIPLVDTPYSLQLTRAIHDVCGISRKSVYTDFEYFHAIARAVTDPGASYSKIGKDFGVPVAAIVKGVKQFLEWVGKKHPTETLKQRALSAMTKDDVMKALSIMNMSQGEHSKGREPL